MTDKEPDKGQPGNTDPGTQADPQEAFWKQLDTHLDSWLERKSKEADEQRKRENPAGTSRTGTKRPTLPGIIADIVFGPPKE
jgi:hypothetical protein